MDYNFTLNSYIELGTAIAAWLTIVLLWKYRKKTEVKYLIYFEFFVSIWALSYAFEFATSVLSKKMLWSQISYLGIAFLPLLYFLFTTAFSQKYHLLSKRNLLLFSIIPVVTLFMALTNNLHHLIWTSVELDAAKNIAIYHHGIWFWIFYAYTQIMVIAGLFNLISSIRIFTAFYKSQISTLIIASFIPIVANFIYLSNFNPFPGFDWTPVSFVLTGLLIALGVVRFRMFDLVPFARNKLIDTMEDGVVVINNEGIIEDCNRAIYHIFNFKSKSIIKKQAVKVFSQYPQIVFDNQLKKDDTFNIAIQTENDTKHFHIRFSPIFNQRREFSGKLLLFHDITQIRKAEIELQETNAQLLEEIDNREKLIEDLDSFAHTVAHDLKNSLGSIYSSSEIMMDCIENNDKELLKDLSELIKDSANKTIQITQELLILATTGHQDVEKKPVQMSKLVSEAVHQLKDLIQEYEAKIILPEKWPIVLGHAPWIEEVWKNLISNGIKYGGNPPVITMATEILPDNKVKFCVKDNGDGISQNDIDKLFKKYVRLNPKKAHGYGLGLSIVKRIIHKLEGEVGVESTGKKGEGAVFYFILDHH